MAAPQQYSGTGFILGGVTDEAPDWLGSFNEGYDTAQRQTEAAQRMRDNAAAEQRRATAFANEQADRQTEIDAANRMTLPGLQTPQGPAFGPMDTQVIPPAMAPKPGLMEEGVTPGSNGAITADQKLAMLPEWARLEQAEGLPPNFLEAMSMLESSGGTNTGSGQKYVGIFQVGPEVAADFGVTPEQLRDPKINAQVAAKLAGRNAKALRARLGREPEAWELYLAHQQGLGGALALLSNANAPAIQALTAAYGGDRAKAEAAIVQNGGNLQMTAGQFAKKWADKFGGALPQPFTGGPSTPEAGLTDKFTRDDDPQATWWVNKLVNMGEAEKRNAYEDIINKVQPRNVIMDEIGGLGMSTENYNKMRAERAKKAEAVQFYRDEGMRNRLLQFPEELLAAQADPIGYMQAFTQQDGASLYSFVEQTNAKAAGTGDPSGAVSPKSDLPAAGLQTPGAPAAPGPVTVNANGVPVSGAPATPAPAAPGPGLAPPASEAEFASAAQSIASDIVPRVTQEEAAGISAPGVGSIGQQIMRAPAGQQAVLPDMGAYMIEPAAIEADLFELQQLRTALTDDFEIAKMRRDFEGMKEIRGKAVQINAAFRLMENMQAVAAMQTGDDTQMAQTLSRLSGGQLRLQPRSDGKYNVYYGGRMTYEGATKDALIASLRSQFDAEYQAQVAELRKAEDERSLKVLESELKKGEEITKRQGDMIKEINVAKVKADLDAMYPEYEATPSTGPDGNAIVYFYPKRGGGQPIVRSLAPDIGVDGQPLQNADGSPRYKLIEYGAQQAVPVQ